MSGSQLWGLFASLGITLIVLALALRLLKRLHWTPGGSSAGVPLRVLKRVSLGPRQSVAILQAADRALIVSIGEGGARLLTEFTGEEAARVLSAPATSLAAPPASTAGRSLNADAKPASANARPSLSTLGRLLGVRFGAFLLVAALAAGASLTPSSIARAQATGGEGSGAPAAALAQAAPSQPPTQQPAPQPAPTTPALQSAPTTTSPQPPPTTPAARSRPATRPAATPAVSMPMPPKVDVRVGEGENALHLTGTVGLVVLIGLMTLLPALFLLMTSFTRILIVLQFLRPALGTQSAPPAQLLAALAVLLTGVVMNPTLQQANQAAVQPFLRGEITQVQAYKEGLVPFREFMLANTRDKDLALFTELSGVDGAASYDEVPTLTLVSAFVTSELRTAFQMGFMIFLPFVILDVIVASVLMSLGMFMLPPMMVSMPFKLLLFVIADGWGLVVQNLVQSFRH